MPDITAVTHAQNIRYDKQAEALYIIDQTKLPGEEREIVFTLTPQDISRYSPELHAWCAAPGRYEIRIGHSSRDIRAVLALQYADAKI